MCEATVYGDTTFTEFTDGFLTEHVKSVSVCDTDLVSKERQVNRCLLLHIKSFNQLILYFKEVFKLHVETKLITTEHYRSKQRLTLSSPANKLR